MFEVSRFVVDFLLAPIDGRVVDRLKLGAEAASGAGPLATDVDATDVAAVGAGAAGRRLSRRGSVDEAVMDTSLLLRLFR